MKTGLLSQYACVAALAALLPLGVASSHGASNPSSLVADDAVLQQATPERIQWEEAKRRKLRRAYWLLEHADSDYHGHRGKAMEEIKKAGEIIGMDLHGEGYSGERQGVSDARMRETRKILMDIVDKGHLHEHEHIWKAIKEIDKALEVR